MTTPPRLKELSKKQLRNLCDKYGLDYTDEMKKSALRTLIKNFEKSNDDPKIVARSREEIVVDFIKALDNIDKDIAVLRDTKKEVRKQYDDNNWLSKDEQKIAMKAAKLLKDGDNLSMLVQYYQNLKEEE